MFEITVRIEAPALCDALNSLAAAIAPAPQVAPQVAPPVQYQAPVMAPAAPVAPPVAPIAPVNIAPAAPIAPTEVPTAAPTYTMEQLAVAATQLVDAGRRNDLIGLLDQFRVQALTALPKEQYGNFATALRQMGAKI